MKMEDKDILKTGTTTVGLVARDGVVLAADKRATSGNLIVTKNTEKLCEIFDDLVVTTAGTVSDIQLLIKYIRAELSLKKIRTGRKPLVRESANLLAGLIYQNIRKLSLIPGISHFILGGRDTEGFHLYDLFADGSLTEHKDYIASGSGSVIAYGVLESMYKKDLSVDETVKLAVRSVNAAMQRDSASGGGIDVISITESGVQKVFNKEINPRIEV
ncbi:MAG: proteasome subunit beta [archaeon]